MILILWAIGALLLFIMALAMLRVFFRQIRETAVDSRIFDFDLADLEKLVESGQMTPEEYQKARAVILSRTNEKVEPVKGFPVLGLGEQPKNDR